MSECVCVHHLFELSVIRPSKTLSNLDEAKHPWEELQRDSIRGIIVFETLKDYHQNNTILLKKAKHMTRPFVHVDETMEF